MHGSNSFQAKQASFLLISVIYYSEETPFHPHQKRHATNHNTKTLSSFQTAALLTAAL